MSAHLMVPLWQLAMTRWDWMTLTHLLDRPTGWLRFVPFLARREQERLVNQQHSLPEDRPSFRWCFAMLLTLWGIGRQWVVHCCDREAVRLRAAAAEADLCFRVSKGQTGAVLPMPATCMLLMLLLFSFFADGPDLP